jgi:hypothetical protein
MSFNRRRILDRKAGENRIRRAPTGEHTRNPGWEAGQYWVECQRCGLDYKAKHIKREWTGAIVCFNCWEPRHPQEYVRGRKERLAVRGPQNPQGLVNDAAKAGSTEAPGSTFIVDSVSTTDLPDRSDPTGTAISTLTTSTCFPTSYFDYLANQTQTVTSYSALNLPGGLSINTTTGDITGTPSHGQEAFSPFATQIEATYTDGKILRCSFTWTITRGILEPTELATTLLVWWDMSYLPYLWTDDEASTNVANDEDGIALVYNRVTGVLDASTGYADTEGTGVVVEGANRPAWDSNVRNGNGAAFFHAGSLLASDEALLLPTPLTDTDEMTVVTIMRIPTPAPEENNAWFGPNNSNGIMAIWDEDEQSYQCNHRCVEGAASVVARGGPIYGTAVDAGSWWMATTTVDGDETTATMSTVWNNRETAASPVSLNVHTVDGDGLDGMQTLRMGATSTGGNENLAAEYKEYLGELLVYNGVLTTTEQDDLFNYMNDKWNLPDELSV